MKKIYFVIAIAIGCLFLASCDEDKFLEEKPQDFMSATNAFITETDFNMSVNDLYDLVRYDYYGQNEERPFDYQYGTDLCEDMQQVTGRHSNMLAAYDPSGAIAESHWENFYKVIAEANTIIDRSKTANLSDGTKTLLEAKARFFRAFSYRTLAYLYGDVPLVLNEVTSPKFDFVRTPKADVLNQVIEDLKFAADHLPDITAVKDGEVSAPAALHLLSEVYLAAGKNQEAVDVATKVISNPALHLMTVRFGSRATETPGDVYWDLFRKNNQNRGSGNTEGIWVMQFETNLPGGGSSTADLKLRGNYMAERNFAPMIGNVTLKVNGKTLKPFRWPVSDYTGGRGIGWGAPTEHFWHEIWKSDYYNDIRNANHNFVRRFPVNNPSFTEATGIDTIDVDHLPKGLVTGPGYKDSIPGRYLFPYQTKVTTPFNHPAELIQSNGMLKSIAGTTFTDQYVFRLAETYLLRAEGYLNLGDLSKAADDINVVRSRAHAKPVQPAQVNIEYILDERMRELGFEERRRLTLCRLGKLYEHVMKYNPYYADPKRNGDGKGMQKTYELLPIPLSFIEANKDAVIQQNPGYVN